VLDDNLIAKVLRGVTPLHFNKNQNNLNPKMKNGENFGSKELRSVCILKQQKLKNVITFV
jgi:hypothetical protein